MPEAAITTYSKDAQQLYDRGIAAARGGQRRIAAGLLTRAVQLDPRHEQAWLWLSGVLDDPYDVEFCLRSALKINPNNAQAQKGLAWVRQRTSVGAPSSEPSRVRSITIPDADAVQPVEDVTPSVWQEWRDSQRWSVLKQRTALFVVVLLIFGTAMMLNFANNEPLPALTELPQASVNSGTENQQIPPAASEINDAVLIDYLSQIRGIRDSLNAASTNYRTISDSSTSSVEQIETARTYNDALRQSYTALHEIKPPAMMEPFHTQYMQGIELESSAIDDVIEYYTNYNVAIANRAALRLQEANGYYQQAIIGWEAYHDESTQALPHPAYSLR